MSYLDPLRVEIVTLIESAPFPVSERVQFFDLLVSTMGLPERPDSQRRPERPTLKGAT
jgi:hypothetical protein